MPSSQAGIYPAPLSPVYAASKAAGEVSHQRNQPIFVFHLCSFSPRVCFRAVFFHMMSRDILPVLHYGRSVPQTAGIRVITICPGFAGLGDRCFAHDKTLHDSPLHLHSHHRHRHHRLQLYHPQRRRWSLIKTRLLSNT
jgi:hypothetical protein